jgi:hypothetical protein
MHALLSVSVAVVVGALGYLQARRFLRNRLRYVDAATSPMAPIIAGVAAGLLGAVVAPILPFVTLSTAVIFGGSVAAGVAAGARDIRRRLPSE